MASEPTCVLAPISIDDVRRLTAHATPCIEAVRRREMPTGYTVALDALAIKTFDSTLGAALIELTLRARDAIQEILDDEHAEAAKRDLALHLWAEDADRRLGSALTEATILVNDEYDTWPSGQNPAASEES